MKNYMLKVSSNGLVNRFDGSCFFGIIVIIYVPLAFETQHYCNQDTAACLARASMTMVLTCQIRAGLYQPPRLDKSICRLRTAYMYIYGKCMNDA